MILYQCETGFLIPRILCLIWWFYLIIQSALITMVMMSKKLLAITVGGLLFAATAADASSPDASAQHQQEVISSCLKVSGLRNAQAAGSIVGFPDDVSYDTLLVRGNYPQPHMNNRAGEFLCLFNRKTRKAYTSEANQLRQSSTQSSQRQR
jgi:hypothetical protein